MFSKLGIAALLSAFTVGVLSMISKFTNSDNIWADITLSSLSEDVAESVVTALSVESVQNALDVLFYDVHLAAVLVGLGVLFFFIALFVKEQ